MEDPGCLRRRQLARLIGWMFTASALSCLGESAASLPSWQVSYPPASNGRAATSTAVPMNGAPMLVTIVRPGANASLPSVHEGNRQVSAQLIGYDPVSSLAFLNVDGDSSKPAPWRDNTDGILNIPLLAQTPTGTVKCSATGWTKQVGTKILPLALLQVAFSQAVPPAGTPLLDPQGKVAAIVFQSSGTGNVGYAIPAEAVHRVRQDLAKEGRLVRGYLGLSLRVASKSPAIVKVLPNSPAATAGIQPGDILQTVGTRRIADYADAANAFFYLIPDQPVQVKLKRGTNQLEYTLTPTRPPAK